MSLKPTIFLAVLVLIAGGGLAQEESSSGSGRKVYDRHEIPGRYTIGLYADEAASSSELMIGRDEEVFDVWIAVSGDSTRSFSGLVMALDLSTGLSLAGPVRWKPRPGLTQSGELLNVGIEMSTPHECVEQKGMAPVVIGRIPVRMEPGVNEGVLTPKPHRDWGLSVELCSEARGWPKPYAEAVPLEVRRKRSLWDRLTGWFD